MGLKVSSWLSIYFSLVLVLVGGDHAVKVFSQLGTQCILHLIFHVDSTIWIRMYSMAK